MNGVFLRQKLSSQSKVDLSRKGAVDEPIIDLITFINNSPAYFTTSSCSGRIYVLENGSEEDQKKKGCQWLYTTHGLCEYTDVEDALKKSTGDASIKFEPFVLHVQCCTMEDARMMHEVAVASGFRNSGITIGKRGKIVVAVRSTHTLEAPLTQNGSLLVDARYIQFIVEVACTKQKENFRRIDLFFERLKTALSEVELSRSSYTGDLIYEDDLIIVPTKHHRKAKASTKVKNSSDMNVNNFTNYRERTVNGRTDDERRTLNSCSLVDDELRTLNGGTDGEFDCMDNCLLFGNGVD